MRATRILVRPISFAAALLCSFTALVVLSCSTAMAGGGGGGADGDNNFFPPIAGVDVDATGVLKTRVVDPRLAQQRIMQARQRAVSEDVMRSSELRKVSLNRLEKAVAERIAAGQPLDESQVAMAGLTRVQYVFFYPESGDIVLAGPAHGFAAGPTGRLISIENGQPTVLLEDLIVALRAYAPQAKPTPMISVSIDPTPEGLQQMQQYLTAVGGRVGPGDTMRLVKGLKDNLGLQNVTIAGIPSATHFARVLVEADYRMKLIGIGLEQLPIPFKGYVALSTSASSSNAMQRWYFQPNYEGVSVSEDRLAMQINGSGVELVGEGERVAGNGQRVAAGHSGSRASEAFCREFTTKYPQIAAKVTVYAELQQLIDLAIAAAYIQEQDFYTQADWNMPVLGNEATLPVETYTAPEKVETAVNAIWRGNTLITPLGGGVSVQPRLALKSENLQKGLEAENADAQVTAAVPSDLEEGQWWWD